MQTVIKPNAALHTMSETYLNFKEYVLVHYFLLLLVSNVVALLVLVLVLVSRRGSAAALQLYWCNAKSMQKHKYKML